MARLSEIYGRRLEARQREYEQKLQDIAAVLDRTQNQVLGERYPPASRPGEAPRMRTGRLRGESTVRVNSATGTVQLLAPTPYAKYLRPTRPWQDITFARARAEIERIEKRSMPFGGVDS